MRGCPGREGVSQIDELVSKFRPGPSYKRSIMSVPYYIKLFNKFIQQFDNVYYNNLYFRFFCVRKPTHHNEFQI